LRAYEQIRNDVSFMDLPVTIVSVGAGFAYGTAGYSHHLIEDFGPMTSIDLDVFTPTMPKEIGICLHSIIKNSRPAYLRLGKGDEVDFGIDDNVFGFPGDLSIIPETDFTILVNSGIIQEVVSVARKLEGSGFSVSILSCWRKTELSEEELNFLHSRSRIVIVEEHVIRGGFGSYLEEVMHSAKNRPLKIGIARIDKKAIGSTSYLRKFYGLNAPAIYSRIIESGV
jgi:transketolase